MVRLLSCAFGLTILAHWSSAACVPDVPERLLAEPQILDHPAVRKAFTELENLLQRPYVDNKTRDGLSVAIVGSLCSI